MVRVQVCVGGTFIGTQDGKQGRLDLFKSNLNSLTVPSSLRMCRMFAITMYIVDSEDAEV